ncbi:IclR family transcriptional regulator [Paenibacillus ginsengarvi]|uniref:IclR family transcriptional regulator n=1 Tax=Paenibacillus ginsengarvi TaxID=400777 RepID=A0A3B0BRI8_9BACL|nr:IclR family transcriptional regulator [Paenibacillus ginsengarvi]RKN75883.1 IclR family transcriptional regulator [Paenibacillus ginsengarvi]
MEQSPAMLTQSVTRALGILSCFSNETPQLRVIDFAKMLNLTQSNVSRLLTTMVSIGYVVKDEATGFYRLGPEIVMLGGVALNNYEIRKQALPELYEIEKRLGLDANLAILDDDTLFYLAHVDSYDSPRMYTYVGRRNPLHCTAMGKVLLAYSEPEETDRLLSEAPMRSFTEHTLVSKDQLIEQFDRIRRKGYATEQEELALGRACLAAPIMGRTGAVAAAISVSGSLSKVNLPEREKELAGVLIELADRISSKMGHTTARV